MNFMAKLSTSSTYFETKMNGDFISIMPQSHTASLRIDDVSNGVLLYPQNPILFANLLLRCLGEPKCHVMYHHIPKTAGTFIASSLYPVFEAGRQYISSKWCCFEIIMEKFFNNTEDYCTKRKMGVYEVTGSQYSQVLETCEKQYSKKGHTFVGLVTTREPVQRTISLIHQQCNGGYETKNSRYQAFCRNCTYDMYSPDSVLFWQQFVDDSNIAYQEMEKYISARKSRPHMSQATTSNNSGVKNSAIKSPILVIDNSMIDDLFNILNVGLAKNNHSSIHQGESNTEILSICNFGMTSAMLRLLRPASSIFLDLWSGNGDAHDIITRQSHTS